jgi:hypothetical protein
MPTADFSTGAASRYLGDPMAGMRRKTDLPTKLCVVCGRPFVWLKKWAREPVPEWVANRYLSRVGLVGLGLKLGANIRNRASEPRYYLY